MELTNKPTTSYSITIKTRMSEQEMASFFTYMKQVLCQSSFRKNEFFVELSNRETGGSVSSSHIIKSEEVESE